MTFDVGEAINYIIDGFLRAPIVNSIAKNPIYTALVITAIIMIIIMMVFRDIDADETLFTLALRSGFWIFIMMLGVLMIHNRVLGAEGANDKINGQYESVFNPSPVRALEPDFVPVASQYVRSQPQLQPQLQPQSQSQSYQPSQSYRQPYPRDAFANAKVE